MGVGPFRSARNFPGRWIRFGRELEWLNLKIVFFFFWEIRSQIFVSLKFGEMSGKPNIATQLKSVANSQSRVLLYLALNYCSFSRWNLVPFAHRFVLEQICPVFAHNEGCKNRSRKVPLISDVNSLPSGTIETMNGYCVMSSTPGESQARKDFFQPTQKLRLSWEGAFQIRGFV